MVISFLRESPNQKKSFFEVKKKYKYTYYILILNILFLNKLLSPIVLN